MDSPVDSSSTARASPNDDKDKYMQMYEMLTERFLTFQRQQLAQLHRILMCLNCQPLETIPNQRTRRALTNVSLMPTVDSNNSIKTEQDWLDFMSKIEKLTKLTETCAEKFVSNLTTSRNQLEKEQKQRAELERQVQELHELIEQDRLKRLHKLRNYATLADDEGDILLSSLMKKAEKNDSDLTQIKVQYETEFLQMTNQLRKLVKEREFLHLYVQRLEKENKTLAATAHDSETLKLLTCASQIPSNFPEAFDLIGKLREEIIQQVKLRDKLNNDLEQQRQEHQIDLKEREQIEQMLNKELNAIKDENLILKSVQTEYDRVRLINLALEKQLEMIKSTPAFTVHELKNENEKMTMVNAELRNQIQKLKIALENSELVQHDFVKLSQTLQIQLEEIRNAETELRWKPEEDFNECQGCHVAFSVSWRKHHCRHCGKVLCKNCTSKVVYTGPNQRASRVCNLCYTLLVKDSQPIFQTSTKQES